MLQGPQTFWNRFHTKAILSTIQGSKISSQSRQLYNKGQNNHLFSYMGPNVNKCACFKDFLSYRVHKEMSADAA